MKFLLQECVVRGKQIQLPYAGDPPTYSNIYGKEINNHGGWIDLNVCTPHDTKLGHAIAEEIVKVLRAHGYEFDTPSRRERDKARGKKASAKRNGNVTSR